MTGLEILGAVGAASLRERIKKLEEGNGLARFILDQLTGEEVAAIVEALLKDPATASKIAIRIPRSLVAGSTLPESVLTDERTVTLRHADSHCPLPLPSYRRQHSRSRRLEQLRPRTPQRRPRRRQPSAARPRSEVR